MFLGGWVGGWVEVKAVLRIAYSNQKSIQKTFIASKNTNLATGIWRFTSKIKQGLFNCRLGFLSVFITGNTIIFSFYLFIQKFTQYMLLSQSCLPMFEILDKNIYKAKISNG
jgi:hypothetical protein